MGWNPVETNDALLKVISTATQPVESSSKGIRQRILLSAAMLHDPSVLVLDEPLTGLDVESAMMTKDLLASFASRGKTVLYSSHVLDVVERFCDRVLIIDQGSVGSGRFPDDLKAKTQEASLEAVFRDLTHSQRAEPRVAESSRLAVMKEFVTHPAIATVLRRLGIDTIQYSVLLDLFAKLRDRQELEKAGSARWSLRIMVGMFAVFSGLINLIVAFGPKPPVRSYVLGNFIFTTFLLVTILTMEAINTFLNPVEASALAHQPIREGTYFAAKLTSLGNRGRLRCISNKHSSRTCSSESEKRFVVSSCHVSGVGVPARILHRTLGLRARALCSLCCTRIRDPQYGVIAANRILRTTRHRPASPGGLQRRRGKRQHRKFHCVSAELVCRACFAHPNVANQGVCDMACDLFDAPVRRIHCLRRSVAFRRFPLTRSTSSSQRTIAATNVVRLHRNSSPQPYRQPCRARGVRIRFCNGKQPTGSSAGWFIRC